MVLKIMMVIPRVYLIYVCGRGGLVSAPLCCGLAVVRVAFWCSGAVEPLLFTSWPPVRVCGPPRLANFDFRALFLSTLKEFFPSWDLFVRAYFSEAGVVFTIPCCLVVGFLWVLAGAGCRLAAFVSTTVVGKLFLVVGGLCAWIPCL